MFGWLERLFAPPAAKSASAPAPASQKAQTPPDAELLERLEALRRKGMPAWGEAARAFSAVPEGKFDEPRYAARVLALLCHAMAHAEGGVRETLGLAQTGLRLLPRMRTALSSARPVAGAPNLDLVEGLLEMRAGRFAEAFPKLARANRVTRVILAGKPVGAESAEDPLANALALATRTLSDLKNPDLKVWGAAIRASPSDPEGMLAPEAVMLAASELIVELHKASAEALTIDEAQRDEILAAAGGKAAEIFSAVHPQAENCRAVMRRVERLFGIGR